jgi:hypothetical protein
MIRERRGRTREEGEKKKVVKDKNVREEQE